LVKTEIQPIVNSTDRKFDGMIGKMAIRRIMI